MCIFFNITKILSSVKWSEKLVSGIFRAFQWLLRHLYVSFLNRFGRKNGYEGPKCPLYSETATYNIYFMPDLESAHFFYLEKLGLLLVISRLGYGIQTVTVRAANMHPSKHQDVSNVFLF